MKNWRVEIEETRVVNYYVEAETKEEADEIWHSGNFDRTNGEEVETSSVLNEIEEA